MLFKHLQNANTASKASFTLVLPACLVTDHAGLVFTYE